MAEKCITASDFALAFDNLDVAVSCLHSWQTLVAGLIAIVAALIGACAINRQIRHAEKLEEERKQRQWQSAQVGLSLAMTRCEAYVQQCEDWLWQLWHGIDGDKMKFTYESFPIIPEYPSLIFDLLIENLQYSDRDAHYNIKNFLSQFGHHREMIEMLRSRLRSGKFEDVKIEDNYRYYFLDYIIDNAIIVTYARRIKNIIISSDK